MSEHAEIIERLHELGNQPIAESVAQRHLARMRGVGGLRPVPVRTTSTRRGIVIGAAAAALTLIVGTATALMLPGTPEGPGPVIDAPQVSVTTIADAGPTTPDTIPGGSDEETAESDPTDSSDPCMGPPDFADDEPSDGATRQSEADEFEESKTDCVDEANSGPPVSTPAGPIGDDDTDPEPGEDSPGGPPGDDPANPPGEDPSGEDPANEEPTTEEPPSDDEPAPSDPFPDDACQGPPPFAGGEPPTEEESAAWEEWKAENCDDPPVQGPSDPGSNG